MAYNKLSLADKLKIKTKQVGDCLVWTGDKSKRGYGRIRINRVRKFAHRVAYELSKGAIPVGLVVMHSCDNPSCINPAHLSVGTQGENVNDMHQKGRTNYLTGDLHPKEKLTKEIVELIRNRHVKSHRTNGAAALAREFNVSKQAVLALLNNVTWK